MLEIAIIIAAIVMLVIASAYDLKWKYIPDYANYSFMLIAVIMRILYAIEANNLMILIWSVPAGVILFTFGYSMYKTGMWGGGDTKLVTGIGILISWFPNETIPMFLDYLANLLIIGGFYGVPAIIIMGLKNKDKIKVKKGDWIMICAGIVASIVVFNVIKNPLMALLVSGAIITGSMIRIFKEIEEKCFKKEVEIPKLMDGDWLLKEIKVGKKSIKCKKEGLSKSDVELLMKWYKQGKIKKALIKDGVAYVPALLVSLIVTLFLGNIVLLMSVYGMPNAELIISMLQ